MTGTRLFGDYSDAHNDADQFKRSRADPNKDPRWRNVLLHVYQERQKPIRAANGMRLRPFGRRK